MRQLIKMLYNVYQIVRDMADSNWTRRHVSVSRNGVVTIAPRNCATWIADNMANVWGRLVAVITVGVGNTAIPDYVMPDVMSMGNVRMGHVSASPAGMGNIAQLKAVLEGNSTFYIFHSFVFPVYSFMSISL